jgi:hypothetical protein
MGREKAEAGRHWIHRKEKVRAQRLLSMTQFDPKQCDVIQRPHRIHLRKRKSGDCLKSEVYLLYSSLSVVPKECTGPQHTPGS